LWATKGIKKEHLKQKLRMLCGHLKQKKKRQNKILEHGHEFKTCMTCSKP